MFLLLQVTTLAVYVYFIASLMGNQYLDPSKGYPTHIIDLFVPIFTFLQVNEIHIVRDTIYLHRYLYSYMVLVFLLHGLVNGSRNLGEPVWRRR